MAQSNVERKPTAVTEEVDLSEIRVKLLVDGLIPPHFGNKKKPKNGEVDVAFFKQGFDMKATITKPDGQSSTWRFAIKKLPSEIVVNRSSWKLEKGMVVLTLHKKEETSWVSMLRRGLEQAESSDSNSSDDEKLEAKRAMEAKEITSTSMVNLKEK